MMVIHVNHISTCVPRVTFAFINTYVVPYLTVNANIFGMQDVKGIVDV